MKKLSGGRPDRNRKTVFMIGISLFILAIPFALLSKTNEDIQSSPPITPVPPDDPFYSINLQSSSEEIEQAVEELEEESLEALGEEELLGQGPSTCTELGGDSCLTQQQCEGSPSSGGRGGTCINGTAFTCNLGCCCDEPDAVDQCPAGTLPSAQSCNVPCFDVAVDPDGDGCYACVAQCSTCPADASCPAVCGDGIVSGSEQCDGGPGCSSNCELESCGNGFLEAGEECDDGNNSGGDGCSPACQIEECGNGAIDSGEQCDDGNQVSGDGCSASCRRECGNGSMDPGEECDDGNLSAGDGCNASCRIEAGCGNGRVESGEQCDDGNLASADGCDQNCVREICGNGVLQIGETCDDGNTVSEDGCDASCQQEMTPASSVFACPDGSSCTASSQCPVNQNTGVACGTGQVCCQIPSGLCVANGNDEVDDRLKKGGITVTQGSSSTTIEDSCTLDLESVIEAECLGSAPDFHNLPCPPDSICFNGACLQLGAVGDCGNGVLDANETCDDGNVSDGDGCSRNCLTEFTAESCEDTDGNDIFTQGETTIMRDENNDGTPERFFIDGFCGGANRDCCLAEGGEMVFEFVCLNPFLFLLKCPVEAPICLNGVCTPHCGNGTIEPSFGEECELGDSGCDNQCRLLCGNGVVDPGEDCLLGDPGCGPDCQFLCGNGVRDSGEDCDPGADENCADDCTWLPFCGDGEKNQATEECDGDPWCDANCQLICPPGIQACASPNAVSGNSICVARSGQTTGCLFPIQPCDSTCEIRAGGEFCQDCLTCTVESDAACVCDCSEDIPCDDPGNDAACQALPSTAIWS